MESFSAILIILGLLVFEVVNSVDNAIINADVLGTVSPRARRWFMTWGLFFGVFVMRGLLPLAILWAAVNSVHATTLWGVFFAGEGGSTAEALEIAAPILLSGSGIFLVFIFLHWLFLEEKHYGLPHEKFFFSQGIWFYALSSIMLSVIVWFAVKVNPMMAFGSTIGAAVFFISHGFKQQAELHEQKLLHQKSGTISDISKLVYLEFIDATFSTDGVLGAFAFTFSIPLILIGNGVGAIVVRYLTVHNVERVKRYIYIKNGAMYSIFFLGSIMIIEAFGIELPTWLAPIMTFGSIGWFYLKSKKYLEFAGIQSN
jgi:hypothetical protein